DAGDHHHPVLGGLRLGPGRAAARDERRFVPGLHHPRPRHAGGDHERLRQRLHLHVHLQAAGDGDRPPRGAPALHGNRLRHGGRLREMIAVPYLAFITPVHVMLAVITTAYANAPTSMFISKPQGTVVDLLVAPLRYTEIVFAMVGGATVRALLVGLLTFVAALFFHERVQVAHPFLALVFPTLTGIGLGAVGLITGVWAEKFEHVNLVPTFVITPLTFLGGVFYDVRQLPETFA